MTDNENKSSTSDVEDPQTEVPGRITKILRNQPQKTLAETLPGWALVLITFLGALLILLVLFQMGLDQTP
jgi:hypothetical protein